MRLELEQSVYKLEGIAGMLTMLAETPEIGEFGEEMQESIILLVEEVRSVYKALQDLQ